MKLLSTAALTGVLTLGLAGSADAQVILSGSGHGSHHGHHYRHHHDHHRGYYPYSPYTGYGSVVVSPYHGLSPSLPYLAPAYTPGYYGSPGYGYGFGGYVAPRHHHHHPHHHH
jgi:hypothetical protein